MPPRIAPNDLSTDEDRSVATRALALTRRIVDASVMPRITSGNTSSPTLMIAEKAAEMMREDRRRG